MARMKKGSPEAKAWGKKMRRMRSGGGKTRAKSRSSSRVGDRSPRRSKAEPPYKVIPDVVELGGLGYGVKMAVDGDPVGGVAVAVGGLVVGKILKHVGKKSKLVRKVNKTHEILGVRMRPL